MNHKYFSPLFPSIIHLFIDVFFYSSFFHFFNHFFHFFSLYIRSSNLFSLLPNFHFSLFSFIVSANFLFSSLRGSNQFFILFFFFVPNQYLNFLIKFRQHLSIIKVSLPSLSDLEAGPVVSMSKPLKSISTTTKQVLLIQISLKYMVCIIYQVLVI